MESKNNDVLMICQTPFHLWLVSKIIKVNEYKNIDILVLVNSNNAKIKYYIELIESEYSGVEVKYFLLKTIVILIYYFLF